MLNRAISIWLLNCGVASLLAVPPSPLHVQGTKVVDAKGHRVKLHGVNICSLEWTAQGDHVLESVGVAIDEWHANIIRVPLSQDRWFGKTQDSPEGGAPYRALVRQVVDKIRARGAYAILDLHWSDGGVWGQDIGQHTLPDAHSVEFWKSCAAAYANGPCVIFDLYNEPIEAPWSVWRDGGPVTEKFQGRELKYQAVGLQTLLDTIRSTGAKNVVHAGGLGYSSRLDFPNSALLSDPKGRGVIYVSHFYPGWENVPSWEARIEKAAKRLPLIVEEFGDDAPSAPLDTPAHRIGEVLAVLAKNNFNWTAWCMHPAAGPSLIADWTYRPTPEYGALVKATLAGRSVPIPPRRMAAPNFKVFDGKLETPWQSWSSATVDYQRSGPGKVSAHAMKVDMGQYQQLQLGTVPFDALAYRSVSFWARSNSPVALKMAASIMDKEQPAIALPTIGTDWTKVTVSFDQLGIYGREDVKSFSVRSVDGKQCTIYVDDFEILGKA